MTITYKVKQLCLSIRFVNINLTIIYDMTKALAFLKLLQELGEAYLVWWCVRDMYLDLEPKDYDFATTIPMDILEQKFKTHNIWKNKDFGIVVIECEWETYEVAQFRADWIYTDGRRPDEVTYVKTIEEDLARRDFTINAMAFDGKDYIDPFGGKADLIKWVIRFVGNAKDRIAEDWLRVLRAYRFAARFKFDIVDEEMMNSFHLDHISQERITDELRKVAWYGSKELAFYVHRLEENNIKHIPAPLFPRIKHKIKHHPEWDVYQHIIHCLSAWRSRDYLTNLCILFHDIGKYYTDVWDWTYYGHDIIWAQKMEEIWTKMKLSKEEIATIQYVCTYHMMWRELPRMKKSNQLTICLHKDYDRLVEVCYADDLSRLYLWDMNKAFEIRERMKDLIYLYETMDNVNARIKAIIDGNIIMKELWVEGKQVWELMEIAREIIFASSFHVSTEDLLTVLRQHVETK